jgi:transposase
MKKRRLVCGVDVSKDTLDLYYDNKDGEKSCLRVGNSPEGHSAALKKIGVKRIFVMESTGPYHLRFATLLRKKRADVRVENPIKIKRFIQMNLERNTTDQKDACWIYRYGIKQGGSPWKMPSKMGVRCSQMMTLLDLYTRQAAQLSNLLHSVQHQPIVEARVIKGIKKSQEELHRKIAALEMKTESILKCWQPDQLRLLRSIPGLGKRAVASLIIFTDGFKRIQNYRQLIALVGLAPRERTSGSSIRYRKKICKMGNDRLRHVLYMCSLSAIKYNEACANLYQRLRAAGTGGKVALVAVCNKLLKQAFAIATKGAAYVPNFRSVNSGSRTAL